MCCIVNPVNKIWIMESWRHRELWLLLAWMERTALGLGMGTEERKSESIWAQRDTGRQRSEQQH